MTPTGIAFRNQLNLVVNREKLLLYNIAYEELTRVLRTAFKENKVSTLRSYQQYLPIGIAGEEKSVNRILNETLVQTQPDKNRQVNYIPLSELVSIVPAEDLKSITAGKNGEYIPLSFYDVENPTRLMKEVKETVKEKNEWEVDFSGSFFSNEKMMGELTVYLVCTVREFLAAAHRAVGDTGRYSFCIDYLMGVWTYAEFDVGYRYYCNLRYCGE